jgi:hypothetical protein
MKHYKSPRTSAKVLAAQREKIEQKNKPQQKEKPAKFNYAEHWKEMPEFNQPNLKPVKTIKVHFFDKDGMHKFSKLVNQLITSKTQSIWFPDVGEDKYMDKRWSEAKPKKK